ncbi:MAG: hypothetical protein LBL93_03915 [Ruminococcus sp.]|jgi:hypothetical protein|nr:hypothetical protein [Ruminococcus sp.]
MLSFSIVLVVQQFVLNTLLIIRVFMEIAILRKQKTADSDQPTDNDVLE